MSRIYRLERVQRLPRPREQVFEFFSDAGNLEAITPAFLHFRILTPRPIELRSGSLIDYRLRLFGVPFSWQTRIESFDPPDQFTDVQLRGPYARWHHRHEFWEVPGGTLMVDTVDYAIGWGPLGPMARELFVARTLERIFDYRRARVSQLLVGSSVDRGAVLAGG